MDEVNQRANGERERVWRMEIVPRELTLVVQLHQFQSGRGLTPSWVFVTEGLAAHDHAEIILAISLRSNETEADVPKDVAALFRALLAAAKTGYSVSIGGRTELEPKGPGLFGRPDLAGVLYTRTDGMDLEVPCEGKLLAIVVTKEELALSRQYGQTRVLAGLGKMFRYYPTAPWCDRDRPPVLSRVDVDTSVIGQTAILESMESSAWVGSPAGLQEVSEEGSAEGSYSVKWAESTVHLRLAHRFAADSRKPFKAIPSDTPLTVLLGVPADLDRCFVWPPAGETANSIYAEGTDDPRIAGNFIMFVSQADANEGKVFEDGFAIILRDDSWKELKKSIGERRDSEVLDDAGNAVLRVFWGD